MVEGFGIEERCRKGCPRSLGVVEGYDKDCKGVGECAVPDIVIVGRPDSEATTVNGEERGKEGWGGEVMMRGEEDAGTD